MRRAGANAPREWWTADVRVNGRSLILPSPQGQRSMRVASSKHARFSLSRVRERFGVRAIGVERSP